MKQCREHNCPLQDICMGAVDNETWWNISDDCEIFAFVSAQAYKIFELENRLKECENGYEGTLHLERCKLHDAEEKVKELTEENERLKKSITFQVVMPDEKMEEIKTECLERVELDVKECRADTVRKMQMAIHEWYDRPCYKPTKKSPIKHTEVQFMLSVIDQIAKEMLEGE